MQLLAAWLTLDFAMNPYSFDERILIPYTVGTCAARQNGTKLRVGKLQGYDIDRGKRQPYCRKAMHAWVRLNPTNLQSVQFCIIFVI